MDDLEIAASALLERLDKEAGRPEMPRTTRVGGYTLAGTELEHVLRIAAASTCRSTGTSLDRELARAAVPKSAGAYLRILVANGGIESSRPIARALANDGRHRATSRLYRLIDLRNEAAHQATRVDPAVAKRVMKSVADWLRPHVPTSDVAP